MANKIELDEGVITLLDEGIVHVHLFNDGKFDINGAKNIFEARVKLVDGKPAPIMYTAAKFIRPTKDVRKHLVSEERRNTSLADAFVLNSVSQRLLSGMYVRFNKPTIPTGIFDSTEEAIIWLKTFIKE